MTFQYSFGSPNPCDQHGVPLTAPAPPQPSEILNGSTSTDGATLLSIPANTTCLVTVTLAGSCASASLHGTPNVVTVGTTVTPAAGAKIAALDMTTSVGTSTTSQVGVFQRIWIYSGSSAASLKFNLGGATNGTATLNGEIVT